MLEPLLSFLHFSAILAWVVFSSSQAALCRVEWLNAAVVRRLGRLNTILWVATAAVLLTGLARTHLGVKGAAWYWGNPLLHVKMTGFAVVALLQLGVWQRLRRWARLAQADGALPAAAEIRGTRRLLMIATHLMALLPLAAVFMARGWGG